MTEADGDRQTVNDGSAVTAAAAATSAASSSSRSPRFDAALDVAALGAVVGGLTSFVRGVPVVRGCVNYAALGALLSLPYQQLRWIAGRYVIGEGAEQGVTGAMYAGGMLGVGGSFLIDLLEGVKRPPARIVAVRVALGAAVGATVHLAPGGLYSVHAKLLDIRRFVMYGGYFDWKDQVIAEKYRRAEERGEWTKGTVFPEWMPFKNKTDAYDEAKAVHAILSEEARELDAKIQTKLELVAALEEEEEKAAAACSRPEAREAPPEQAELSAKIDALQQRIARLHQDSL
ncbi:hypothetical protein FVE85_9707 [Porphyridium purpureum]|uniref:Uncharacterized protein n=1 Tax=Porphyridium purpureum TaxID=35688 RepID=A0A5J4YL93_PORPP|nr:hypothetical protein FVE85_9707 [Porphyridium purpureum]|eukprot:POR9386..scf246_12